jgi:putative MFS transporter
VVYALLAETMPSRHRGWALVLVGGLGAVGGYLASSGCSAWLQPVFGWRIMWFLNLPTGLILIALSGFIPESAKFLMAIGRRDAAHAVMKRFGSVVREKEDRPEDHHHVLTPPPVERRFIGKTAALSIAAVAWGLVNFGLLLWLPAELVAEGHSVGVSSQLLAKSALIAFPTVFVCAFLYSRWSTKWSMAATIAVSALGVAGVLTIGPGVSPVLPVALMIIGTNGLLAILLPYTAESFPLRIRGRATGWVAACSKSGGLIAQLLGILAAVPPLKVAALMIIAPLALALVLVAWFGTETRGRDLRELEG